MKTSWLCANLLLLVSCAVNPEGFGGAGDSSVEELLQADAEVQALSRALLTHGCTLDVTRLENAVTPYRYFSGGACSGSYQGFVFVAEVRDAQVYASGAALLSPDDDGAVGLRARGGVVQESDIFQWLEQLHVDIYGGPQALILENGAPGTSPASAQSESCEECLARELTSTVTYFKQLWVDEQYCSGPFIKERSEPWYEQSVPFWVCTLTDIIFGSDSRGTLDNSHRLYTSCRAQGICTNEGPACATATGDQEIWCCKQFGDWSSETGCNVDATCRTVEFEIGPELPILFGWEVCCLGGCDL